MSTKTYGAVTKISNILQSGTSQALSAIRHNANVNANQIIVPDMARKRGPINSVAKIKIGANVPASPKPAKSRRTKNSQKFLTNPLAKPQTRINPSDGNRTDFRPYLENIRHCISQFLLLFNNS